MSITIDRDFYSGSIRKVFFYPKNIFLFFVLKTFVSPTLQQVARPGTSHADELLYLFDVELPIILCDIGELTADLPGCLANPVGCVLPTSPFRSAQCWGVKFKSCFKNKKCI